MFDVFMCDGLHVCVYFRVLSLVSALHMCTCLSGCNSVLLIGHSQSLVRLCMCVCVLCDRVCVCTYSYDVNKVIFPQCVEDCIDGVFGYGQSESLHAATGVHHNYHVFRRSGGLDIPGKRQTGSRDVTFIVTQGKKPSGMNRDCYLQ